MDHTSKQHVGHDVRMCRTCEVGEGDVGRELGVGRGVVMI
jgi:hypothetical protein